MVKAASGSYSWYLEKNIQSFSTEDNVKYEFFMNAYYHVQEFPL